jgi:hypothetical protein
MLRPHRGAVAVPITGNRGRRILQGVLNVRSGDVLLDVTERWNQDTHQEFLRRIRSQWRGGNPVIFEDRASQPTAPRSLALAKALRMQIRLLPKATPELNALDHLWRPTKRETQANRLTIQTIEDCAQDAFDYIYDLTPHERLRLAGVLSGDFWLTE